MKSALLFAWLSLPFLASGQITFEPINSPNDFNISTVRESPIGEYFIQTSNDRRSIYTSINGQDWTKSLLPEDIHIDDIQFFSDGTPLALYPVLKKYNQSMAIATVSFRLLEATMIIIGILSLLTIVTLSHQFSKEVNPDTASYLIAGKSLLALHNWTFLFGPNLALGPSTFLTSYVLYKSNLVPRFISISGLVGGPLIFSCAILVIFGFFPQLTLWGGLMAIPVFLYEMSLAIRLLAKGFNSPVVDAVTVLR